jgi:DNA-binding NtrC family response regulator
MAAEKRVLLARPHAFIVNQMRPFLLDAGYVAVGAQNLEHLRTELASNFNGAIISTAVTSTVGVDAAAVFRLVRERQPRLPVVFAGMADAATMRTTAERAVKELVASPVFAGPDDYRLGADRQTSFLILRKDDLLDADAVERAARALRSHFG